MDYGLRVGSFGPVPQHVELADQGAAGGKQRDDQGRGGGALLGGREGNVSRARGGDVDLEDDVAAAVLDLQAAAGGRGGIAPGNAADAVLHARSTGGVGN